MKWIIVVIFWVYAIVVFAQPQAIQVRYLQDYNYYPGGGQNLKPGANCFVVTSRKQMKKLFGETNRVDTPDFSKEWMLVLVMPRAKWHNKVDIKDVTMKAGKTIEVYCSVDESNKKLTYDFSPIKVCTIPMYKGITKINFYEGRHYRHLASLAVD